MNAIALASLDYEMSPEAEFRNHIISYINASITAIFLIELIIKVTAMGFVLNRHSYLRDYLNWLDLIIVCAGYIILNYSLELSVLFPHSLQSILKKLQFS